MVFVENKRKELLTSYKADTPEVGVEQTLLPETSSKVLRRNRVGIG